jgi:hypothetical protein
MDAHVLLGDLFCSAERTQKPKVTQTFRLAMTKQTNYDDAFWKIQTVLLKYRPLFKKSTIFCWAGRLGSP